MTSKEKMYLRRKWRKWLGVIGRDLSNLVISRNVMREIFLLVAHNEKIISERLLYNWMVENYLYRITTGIRRLNDKDEKSISLCRLIEDILKNREAMTRSYYISQYPKQIREKGDADFDFDKFSNKNDNLISAHRLERDKKQLKKETDCIRVFVNKWIAHCDLKRKTFRIPSNKNLDKSLGHIDELFCKYHMLITQGGMNTCIPVLQFVWEKEPLRRTWLTNNYQEQIARRVWKAFEEMSMIESVKSRRKGR